MRTTSIVLCVALLFNGVFYSISLNISITEAKFDAKEKLSRQIPNQELTLIKIPFNDVKEIEEKELWHNDKLYDIASTEIINDTVYYYALEDHKEEETIGRIYEHFNSEFNSLNPHTFKLRLHKSSVKGIFGLYCFNQYEYKLYRGFSILNHNNQNKSCNLGIHKVLTPPPKNYLISNFNI